MSQKGMICTRCHIDTGCDPDLSHLSTKHVSALCAGWLCAKCMDEDPEIQAFEAEQPTGKPDSGEIPNDDFVHPVGAPATPLPLDSASGAGGAAAEPKA